MCQPKSLEAQTSVTALRSAMDMKSPKIGRHRRAKSAVCKHGHPCDKKGTYLWGTDITNIKLQLCCRQNCGAQSVKSAQVGLVKHLLRLTKTCNSFSSQNLLTIQQCYTVRERESLCGCLLYTAATYCHVLHHETTNRWLLYNLQLMFAREQEKTPSPCQGTRKQMKVCVRRNVTVKVARHSHFTRDL